MKHPIGFVPEQTELEKAEEKMQAPVRKVKPSVVQVYFPANGRKLAYYNDQFVLDLGDLVYVDGTMEGLQGYVAEISYNFKIRLEDYKKVIGKAETHLCGKFCLAGSHYISFDPQVLTRSQVITWFRAPEKDSYVVGYDDSSFPLDTLEGFEISEKIAERGLEYYRKNRVCYLSLRETDGYAIVQGTKAYEVTFLYEEGRISRLKCDCFCSYNCKHEFAVLLQLRETLEKVLELYPDAFQVSHGFAAVDRDTFKTVVLDHQKTGTVTLSD